MMELDPAYINVAAQPVWEMPTQGQVWNYAGKLPNEKLWWNSPTSYSLILADRLGSTVTEKKMQIDLPVPPEAMAIRSEFAANLAPTFGGVVSEHNGMVFKTIEMSGSFGVLPFSLRQKNQSLGSLLNVNALDTSKAVDANNPLAGFLSTGQSLLGGANAVLSQNVNTNNPLFNQANALAAKAGLAQAGSGLTYDTGYGAWRWVTFFFENYAALRKASKYPKYVMLLRILKEERDYFVEPIDYSVIRSKENPYAYNYRITFRSWGSQPIDLTDQPAELFSLLSYASQAREIVADTGLALSLGSDFITSVGRAIANTTDILKDVGATFNSLLSIPANILNLPSVIAKGIEDNIVNLTRSINGGINANVDAFNNLVNDFNQAFSKASPSTATLANNTIKRDLKNSKSALSKAQSQAIQIALSNKPVNQLTSRNASLSNAVLANQRRVAALSIDDWKKRQLELKKTAIMISQATGNSLDLVAQTYGLPTSRPANVRPSIKSVAIQRAVNNGTQMVSMILAQQKQPSQSQTNFLRSFSRVAQSQNVTLNTPAAKVLAPVLLNQSLEQMAQKYLGDASRWNEIAALNNLKAPYIDENGVRLSLLSKPVNNSIFVSSNTIVKVGEIVFLSSRTKKKTPFEVISIVPRSTSQQITVAPVRSLAKLGAVDPVVQTPVTDFTPEDGAVVQAFLPNTTNSGEAIFLPSEAAPTIPATSTASNFANVLVNDGNEDLAIGSDGDLALEGSDFRTVDGVTNIEQQIKLILQTPKGSLLQHPEFGVKAIAGISVEDLDLNDLVADIQTQIAADPSLGTVVSISAVLVQGAVQIKMAVMLRSSNIILPLSFSIRVAAGA